MDMELTTYRRAVSSRVIGNTVKLLERENITARIRIVVGDMKVISNKDDFMD